jgi:hypothetical protein
VLAKHLKDNYAEVKAACSVQGGYQAQDYLYDEQAYQMQSLSIDSMAFSVFDIRILEGSNEFLALRSNKVAITRRAAQRMFGNESPIGKDIYDAFDKKQPLTICAVVSEWPNEHSNINYDILDRCYSNNNWGSNGWQTFVRLHENSSSEAFTEKIARMTIDVPD